MPKLRVLSGKEIVKILESFGFFVEHVRGSHIKLDRTFPDGSQETLMVPGHANIKKGTLKSIYRQAMQYIPEEDLRKYFYSE